MRQWGLPTEQAVMGAAITQLGSWAKKYESVQFSGQRSVTRASVRQVIESICIVVYFNAKFYKITFISIKIMIRTLQSSFIVSKFNSQTHFCYCFSHSRFLQFGNDEAKSVTSINSSQSSCRNILAQRFIMWFQSIIAAAAVLLKTNGAHGLDAMSITDISLLHRCCNMVQEETTGTRRKNPEL